MKSSLLRLVACATVLVALSACASKTTNGGPYAFQGAADVASVAHMTGCVSQLGGHGLDPNGYVMCNEGDVNWSGGASDDASTMGLTQDGLAISGASFEIGCDSPAWCKKALAALLAWVSPANGK